MHQLLQLASNGIVEGLILAIAAVGVSLVYGVLHLVNFAHGDYLTVGAYVAFLFNVTWKLPLLVALPLSMVAVAVLSVGVDRVLWRPLRRRRAGQLSFFLASVGVALIMRQVLLLVAKAQSRELRIDKFATHVVGGIRLGTGQVVAAALGFVAIVALGVVMQGTGIGRRMRAYADNAELASVAGVNVDHVVLTTWIIGGALAALAGVLQAIVQSSFNTNMGWSMLLPAFAAVVLGSIGNPYGALLGGLLLGVVMEVSTWSSLPAGGVPSVYKPVVAFVVLAAVLVVRPQGLLGWKARAL